MSNHKNTHLAHGWTACESYSGHIIAVNDGKYRSFRGYGGLARTRPCDTKAECRRMIDKYNADEDAYHRSTGHW